jgi:hypothetical protein
MRQNLIGESTRHRLGELGSATGSRLLGEQVGLAAFPYWLRKTAQKNLVPIHRRHDPDMSAF